ncbi:DUF4349 domain-containing protein [Desulfosporosinus sp.]|uniref:DUF4349 domain-containing protein n=1 Tax=Desulfosporosinus sp. TaxID=157907 RepID=UPI0025BD8A86|nr:DUF4349 domain-containing protein [Desulfosporosinus sp.]MBC2725100.1 DUF4349 domain-containing protein [Desulfosporosinus sp.]
MKRFFKKTDLTALWEEDGDLQRMKEFFYTIEADSESHEQIKQSIKQKALEKLARTDEFDFIGLPEKNKEGLSQRIRAGILALGNMGRLRLSVSIAGLAILLIIAQSTLTGSLNLFPRMGNSAKLAQFEDIAAPQAPLLNGAMEADVEIKSRNKVSNDSSMEYSSEGSSDMSSAAGILPIPPDQAIVPPADAGLPRKMIHDLSLTLEVTNINDTVTLISKEVQKLEGYVISSRQSGRSNHSSAQLTAKIPADKLSVLRDSFSSWGKVLDQQLIANDITNQYYDTQTRLQVLEAEEKRYLEILNQAKTVDDVLKVENALGNVRQQIELLKGQLKLWNNQVDFSTVTFEIITRQSPNVNVTDPWQPIAWSETWKATGDAVLKTLSTTWNGLNYLVVGLGYAIPYLLIGTLGWIIYRVWKKRDSSN